MALRPDEISALIKEQIKHYDDVMEQKDVGTVMTVGDGVSVVHGLDNAMLGELILFPGDVYGMVMNLDEDSVGVTLLGNADEIKEGDEVRRTGKIIEVPVGDAMLGRVVNPLGQPIDGQGEITPFGIAQEVLQIAGKPELHAAFRVLSVCFKGGSQGVNQFLFHGLSPYHSKS